MNTNCIIVSGEAYNPLWEAHRDKHLAEYILPWLQDYGFDEIECREVGVNGQRELDEFLDLPFVIFDMTNPHPKVQDLMLARYCARRPCICVTDVPYVSPFPLVVTVMHLPMTSSLDEAELKLNGEGCVGQTMCNSQRTYRELVEAEDRISDLAVYTTSGIFLNEAQEGVREATPHEVDGAHFRREWIREKYNLPEFYPEDPFESGRLLGTFTTLRWVMMMGEEEI